MIKHIAKTFSELLEALAIPVKHHDEETEYLGLLLRH